MARHEAQARYRHLSLGLVIAREILGNAHGERSPSPATACQQSEPVSLSTLLEEHSRLREPGPLGDECAAGLAASRVVCKIGARLAAGLSGLASIRDFARRSVVRSREKNNDVALRQASQHPTPAFPTPPRVPSSEDAQAEGDLDSLGTCIAPSLIDWNRYRRS